MDSITLPALDDAECGIGGPYGTVLASPLDGPPWVQAGWRQWGAILA